jgi:hypothetical protein
MLIAHPHPNPMTRFAGQTRQRERGLIFVPYAASTGSVPTIVVRCMTRRSVGSNGVT